MKARELGIIFDGLAGKNNAITDVRGVLIGHSTIIEKDGDLAVGKGPIRTGVTAIFPVNKTLAEVHAAIYSYNGNGEMTGSHWIKEAGKLRGPICITNTHSVGLVRDSIIKWSIENGFFNQQFVWFLPVVAETYDGILNDINGFHVKEEHVILALENATDGQVQEGNVGGGTGMICHQFKGGIGTSSRIIVTEQGKFGLGVLVQANYGIRNHLTISGVPVGEEMKNEDLPKIKREEGIDSENENGSIIVILATDAPLLPYQLKRLTKRIPAGLARVGGYGGHTSGDIFLAFSTHNKFDSKSKFPKDIHQLESLDDSQLSIMFKATAEATEEAIINALVNAETMKGINGNTVYSISHDRIKEILVKYNRIVET